VKRLLQIGLGVVTGVGGFLEAGSLTTAVQAGSEFRFGLIWTIVLGSICLAALCEMAGRFSAVSKRAIPDAIRERFGFNYFAVVFTVMLVVMFLTLLAELGGVCIAIELATGIGFPWWSLPVGLVIWLVLWRGSFGLIENGVSLLGLVTLAFVVAAVKLHPDPHGVIAGLVPHRSTHDPARYWFLAVSVLGASISPYLLYFYSSGVIEDRWDSSYLGVNRITAGLGMTFGGVVSIGALIVAAIVFWPRHVRVEHFEQMSQLLPPALGRWGVVLFIASLGFACFGAALELALTIGYLTAQGLGWDWSENLPPAEDARFSLTYTVVVIAAGLVMITGVDPLQITVMTMALTALTLPFSTVPFLILMNDRRYMQDYGNGPIANLLVSAIIVLTFLLAAVSLPLEILGGG
jgi:Mn2+/Fe2+ NRAMP family transporter